LFIDEAIPTIESQSLIDHKEVLGVGNMWMNQKRDNIAACIWKDYQSYIQRSR
jgi:hypothetical protein